MQNFIIVNPLLICQYCISQGGMAQRHNSENLAANIIVYTRRGSFYNSFVSHLLPQVHSFPLTFSKASLPSDTEK
jgi:hypothetical protein